MAPYFSVILPIYNVERYLHRCVCSILDQSFQDLELILVDDGSTDSCPEICDALAARDSRVRVLHKPNGGLSSARNAGLEQARGTYIWWVDSDDWIEPEALAALHRESCEDQPDVVKFNYFRITDRRKRIESCAAPGTYGEDAIPALLDQAFFSGGSFCLSAWTHLYRRAFLQEKGMAFVSERQVCSEDYLFNLELMPLSRKIRVTDLTLYNYEQHPGSLTQGYRKDLFAQYTLLYRQLEDRYRSNHLPDAYQRKLRSFYIWHLFHGTCMSNEYQAAQGHILDQGRRNIRNYLRSPDLQHALDGCACAGFSGKKKLQLLAMRLRLEPLFYWLYVVKPKGKKGNQNETEN